MTRTVTEVDVEHLVKEHGIDRQALTMLPGQTRAQRRHLTLYYEMKHAADHAQRRVAHDHD